MGNLLATPPPTHLIYIPIIVLLGVIIGFVIGRKAGIREGKAEYLGAGDDDLL